MEELSDRLKYDRYAFAEIEVLDYLSRLWNDVIEESKANPDDFSSNIPSLKKRIKYCKNPLERKSLEMQLNDAYRAMKKRR